MARVTADHIADDLRTRILSGTLGSGVQLKQEQLAQAFGVSRIPVREALRRLEAEGLVVHELYKGSVVAGLSLKELIETLDVRIALETRALKLALPHFREEDLALSAAILERYDRAQTPLQWSELNLAFHLSLYRPAAHAPLERAIDQVVRGIARGLRVYTSITVGREHPQTEHYAILDACARRDEASALARLEAHIAATQEALRKVAAS